jgi:hypothetical protein
MTDTTARFSLPYILPAQAQKHLTHNEALRQLDLFLHLCIQEDDRATPPTTPNENDAYIIPSIATGAWSGRGTQIAIWIDGLWQFFLPVMGWVAWVKSTGQSTVFDGQSWTKQTAQSAGDGKSAYDLALDQGFSGTIDDWLASLVGQDGQDGATGPTGPMGSEGAQGPQGAQGQKGDPGTTL